MFSRCLRKSLIATAWAMALALSGAQAADRELRVCADPDNLPYSHENGSGFENRIASLLASELGAKLAYTWHPQRRAFVRNTLNAGRCDVIIGVPADFDLVRTTRPYYRSSYVFVSRADGEPPYTSFDDARLARARVGVQLVGDDLAATPPGHALAVRGIVENVTGFLVFGERPQPQRMIEALASGELDVALIWGPQAGFYARAQRVPLEMRVARAPPELAAVPFEYSISMGVRKRDQALHAELDALIARRLSELTSILRDYGVPLAEAR